MLSKASSSSSLSKMLNTKMLRRAFFTYFQPTNVPFIPPTSVPFIPPTSVPFIPPTSVPFIPPTSPFIPPTNVPFIPPNNVIPPMTQDPYWSPFVQWNPTWNPQWTVSKPWKNEGLVSSPVAQPTPQEMHQKMSHMRQLDQFQRDQDVSGITDKEVIDYRQKYPGLVTAARLNSGLPFDSSSFSHSRGPYAPTWAPFFQSETGMGFSGLSSHHLPANLTRFHVIEILMNAKRENKLTFKEIAEQVGRSEFWTASAVLGQQAFSEDEADKLLRILNIDSKVAKHLKPILVEPPMRGSLNGRIPVDPTIYQLYEILQVYGTTLKALTHEKVGDGIMSAVNLEVGLDKKTKKDGDYVELTLTGQFEPFKKW